MHTLPLEACEPIIDLCGAGWSALWQWWSRGQDSCPQAWQYLNISLSFCLARYHYIGRCVLCLVNHWQTSFSVHKGPYGWVGTKGTLSPNKAVFVSLCVTEKALCLKLSINTCWSLANFDISNCRCTFEYKCCSQGCSSCVCVSLWLYSEPIAALSELECDDWAEEDPGIRASVCSSSVLSSVEEKGRKTKAVRFVYSVCSTHRNLVSCH